MADHYSLQTEYGAADELFKAIITLDKKHIKKLKASGVSLTENVRSVLENGAGRSVSVDNPAYQFWFSLIREIKEMPIEDFSGIAAILRAEVDKPLHYSEALWLWGNKRAFEPRFFEITLKNFNQKRMSKSRSIKQIILENQIGSLPICEKHGWLKMPKTRDELIEYANANGKTEAAAWLLDFKNRTADLSAERARAEKRMLRELNANPNSLTELRKIWRTKKLDDDTLEITGYKGKQTEVIVPEKIGKEKVTSIGSAAFSGAWYLSKRTAKEICEFRQNNITKITLPETITRIGEYAFYYCQSLKEVNIPLGVKVIENSVFRQTAIEVLELPESVESLADYSLCIGNFKEVKLPQSLAEIGERAFQMCGNLEKIEIPARVKEILQEAFWQCVKLKEIVLPEGIETIKARAFWECPELEAINLPATIKKIENFKRNGKPQHVFADSPKLTATVERGSYAEKYCAKNNIIYKYKEET